MERCIVKLDEQSFSKKEERFNKIIKEASTQSGRQIVPTILKPTNFKNIIENIEKYDIVLLPYENEKNVSLKQVIKAYLKSGKPFQNIAIIIGPEGGFSQGEIDMISKMPNVYLCTLGKRILRTETAGLAVVSMITYEIEL